jgi:hypothetical protein
MKALEGTSNDLVRYSASYRSRFMKTARLLIAAVLVTGSMAAISYADSSNGCGGTISQPCAGYTSISDKILFTKTGITDAAGSPTPVGTLNSFGGANVSVLDYTTDYLNWTHNFTFNPSVRLPDGIIRASLSVSLVDFESNVDVYGREYGDRDHEHDEKGDDKSDGKGGVEQRKKKQKQVNGKNEDDREEYSIDLSCIQNTNSGSSAAIRLEGTSAWINIPSIQDATNTKFAVLLSQLYDGSFSVELKSTLNDFEIEWSRLDIGYCPAVPEPGTMLLLGVGMLSLAVFGKRRMNRNS